jgi:hypothetical protein
MTHPVTAQFVSRVARIVGLLCAFIIPAALVYFAARRNYKKIRDAQQPGLEDTGNFIVTYAAAPHFRHPGKGLVYQAIGRLQIGRDGISFKGAWNGGGDLQLFFPAQHSKAAWVGRTFRTLLAVWFVIELEGERHYFSSDAILRGPLALGSFKSSVQKIYREVAKVLGSSSNR